MIDQAIGIIRSRSGVSAEEAFDRLTRLSQTENVKLTWWRSGWWTRRCGAAGADATWLTAAHWGDDGPGWFVTRPVTYIVASTIDASPGESVGADVSNSPLN